MPKNSGYIQLLNMELAKQKAIHAEEMYIQGMTARMQVLDRVTITLGEMGFNGDDLALFEDMYCKTERDYCETVTEDSKELPKTELQKKLFLCEAKDTIDKKLQEYVRPDRFHSYDERYAF